MNTSVGVADATFWQNVAYLTQKHHDELDTME
jgi:hypothetical protein